MNPPTSAPTQPRNGQDAPPPAAAQRVTPQLAPPPKMRRRPLLIVAAVAAICLGALLGVLAYTSVSSAREVVAVRTNVDRGTEITRDDLMTVRIGVDPALATVPAAQIEELVGMRAERDLVAGGIVTPDQVTHDSVPAQGKSVVGLSLSPALVPAGSLRTGDPVRVVFTNGNADPNPDPETVPAIVVGISADSASGNTLVNVEVARADAARVAANAASNRASIVLDAEG